MKTNSLAERISVAWEKKDLFIQSNAILNLDIIT